jgi:hypothetical protein
LVAQVKIFDVTRLVEAGGCIAYKAIFLKDRCFMDKPHPFLGDDIDDNHQLDFDDFDDDSVASGKGCPSQLSPLGLPWSSRESSKSELLTACIAKVDLASCALYAMEHHIQETDLDRNDLYKEACSKEVILRHLVCICAHMDNGLMIVCTTNVVWLL